MLKKFVLFLIMLFLTSCSNQIKYEVKPGNEAFVLGNNSDVGVLLTHGFEASPYQVRGLAEYLAKRNITVYVVRLSGHGTDINELDKTKWEQWYSDYEKGYNTLSNKTKKVFVGGHSLGGSIALYLAEQKDTAGVISLAAPAGIKDKRAEYAWLIKYYKKYEARELKDEELGYNYDRYSSAAVQQLVRFIKTYKKDLSKVTEPLLVMQISNETEIEQDSSNYIYQNVRSKDKKLVIINATGHGLFEKEFEGMVYSEVYSFIRNN